MMKNYAYKTIFLQYRCICPHIKLFIIVLLICSQHHIICSLCRLNCSVILTNLFVIFIFYYYPMQLNVRDV